MKMMIDKMKLNKTQNEAKFHEDAKSSMYNSLQKKQDDCRKCDGMMEEERAGLSNLALLLPGQCRPCPAETEGDNSTSSREGGGAMKMKDEMNGNSEGGGGDREECWPGRRREGGGVQNSTPKRKRREIDKPEKSAPGAQSPDDSQKCKISRYKN